MDRLETTRTRDSRARQREWALCSLLIAGCGACASSEPPARQWSIVRLRDGRGLMVRDVTRSASTVSGWDGHDRAVNFDTSETVRVDAMPAAARGADSTARDARRPQWHWAARGLVAVPTGLVASGGFASASLFAPIGIAPVLLLNVAAAPPATSAALWAVGRETGGRGSYAATLVGTYAGIAAQAAIVFAVMYSTPVLSEGWSDWLLASYLFTLPLPHLAGWIAFEIDGHVASRRRRE